MGLILQIRLLRHLGLYNIFLHFRILSLHLWVGHLRVNTNLILRTFGTFILVAWTLRIAISTLNLVGTMHLFLTRNDLASGHIDDGPGLLGVETSKLHLAIHEAVVVEGI